MIRSSRSLKHASVMSLLNYVLKDSLKLVQRAQSTYLRNVGIRTYTYRSCICACILCLTTEWMTDCADSSNIIFHYRRPSVFFPAYASTIPLSKRSRQPYNAASNANMSLKCCFHRLQRTCVFIVHSARFCGTQSVSHGPLLWSCGYIRDF